MASSNIIQPTPITRVELLALRAPTFSARNSRRAVTRSTMSTPATLPAASGLFQQQRLRIAGRLDRAKQQLRAAATWARVLLVEIDTYTQLVDGFKNVVDLQRHIYER